MVTSGVARLAFLGHWLVLGGYFACLLVMTAYGLHRAHLLSLYLRHRHRAPRPASLFATLPHLTVQLPLYNEIYVAGRLLDAVASLDYPRDRLEVQVLDDSTDETTERVADQVLRLRVAGLDIVHLRRDNRDGFKAGALAAGLARAKGEFLAIFDADFVPRPGFARNLIHHFTDPRLGMVQARWAHLNASHSALTRVQSILLDGHFVIEHAARNRAGRFFNFNGTAGIWRKSCIEDAGGWQGDTLTEDLDLSYRAQLRGWKFVFRTDEEAPAELPVEMGAFKAQQHRWAKGSIQTARKLLPRILRADLPLAVKVEAVAHLTANLGYVAMLLLSLLVVPAMWLRVDPSFSTIAMFDLPLFALAMLPVVVFYLLAAREVSGRWRGTLRWMPFLIAVGVGLSVNNTGAVIEAACGRKTAFARTPKYNLAAGEKPNGRHYRGGSSRKAWLELLLALNFAVALLAVVFAGRWAALPFLLLFATGFSYTSLSALLEPGRGRCRLK